MSQVQIKSVRWWHEQIVDVMLLRPDWTQNQIAEYFDVTPAWLSTVINSDLFQAYYDGRRRDHQEDVSDTVIERTEKLAGLTLDVLTERIAKEREEIPLGPVRETAEMALKALGYGAKGAGAAPTQISFNFGVTREALAEARERQRKQLTIEEEPSSDSSSGREILVPAE